jgi:hypothetical protein
MRMSDPISTNDGERDRNIIRDNLMAQLCNRQHNFDMNGGDQRWSFTEIRKSGFSGFTDRKFIDKIVDEYRNETDYFDIDNNDKVGLADRGKRYCKERQ